MNRPSLRWLLLGSVLATITVGFAVFAIQLDRVERNNRIADIDDELGRAERNTVGRTAGPQDAGPTAPEVDLNLPIQLIIEADGTVTSVTGGGNPFSEQVLESLQANTGTQTIDDPNYRVRTTPAREGGLAVTALSLDELDAAVARFRTALVFGGTVLLLLVALVLWAITGYLLRPVARMAETASRIADGELDTSVGEPSGSRETADLAIDLDRMLARLRSALDDAQQSASEATAARTAMERFLADMAHELRTPLTALKGYSDLYAKGMLEQAADVDRAMERIGSESDRLTDLANGMLQLARSGEMIESAAAFDLSAMVRDVAQDLRAAYPDHQLIVDVESDAAIDIHGVSGKLHQAVLNLGSNACHHSPSSEPIVFKVEQSADAVSIRVIDHGSGIEQNELDEIFQPFYRSDSARSRDGQAGAGLGLALVKQIAVDHQGDVTVEATPGGGATFVMTIPRGVSP